MLPGRAHRFDSGPGTNCTDFAGFYSARFQKSSIAYPR